MSRASPQAARSALRAWLAKHGKSSTWLAEQMEVSQPTASRWLGSGRPEDVHREALEIITGVPGQQWLTSKEAAYLRRVKARVAADSAVARAA